MSKLDIDKAFPEKKKQKRKPQEKRTHDVRVSINGSGEAQLARIRIGLLNKAKEVFGDKERAAASDIRYTKDRIYFIATNEDEKSCRFKSYKLQNKSGLYFSFVPEADNYCEYLRKWVGKIYPLHYDSENDRYYIYCADGKVDKEKKQEDN